MDGNGLVVVAVSAGRAFTRHVIGIAFAISGCADDDVWPRSLDIAYSDEGEIRLAHASDMIRTAMQVDGEFSSPVAWSPCGDELALRERDSSRLLGVSSSGLRDLGSTAFSLVSSDGGGGHWWSPDGARLASIGALYYPVGAPPACDWVDATFVCDVATLECSERFRGEFRGDASWSPDGVRLAVVTREVACTETRGEVEYRPWHAEVIDVDGGYTPLSATASEARALAWSPRGDVLVVALQSETGHELVVWNPGDDRIEARHATAFQIDSIAWFPEGDRWMVVSGVEPSRIAILAAPTAEPVAELLGYDAAILAPDGERVLAHDDALEEYVVVDLITGDTRPAVGRRHRWRTDCD